MASQSIAITSAGQYSITGSGQTWGIGSYGAEGQCANLNFGPAALAAKTINTSNYGFSIPSTATILGMSLHIRNACTGDTMVGTVQLVGTSTKPFSFSDTASSFTDRDFGSSVDLWGASLTYSDVNSSSFGVTLIPSGTYTDFDQVVGAFSITVYYSYDVSQTITGVSRIQTTQTRTITGVSSIATSTQRTITGVSRISATQSRTITGRASIMQTRDQTITGRASIYHETWLDEDTGVSSVWSDESIEFLVTETGEPIVTENDEPIIISKPAKPVISDSDDSGVNSTWVSG